jgi:mRNA deadenylase 3'-5' endonuclease subunit Ccr4
MVFTLGTWNILATAYIRPVWYPDTPREILDPKWRIPALVQRARSLNVDILCLQEVELTTFEALREGLAAHAYGCELAMKDGRPDGCATFYRREMFSTAAHTRLPYADGLDGGAASGHIALKSLLVAGERRLAILNTHLKWDAPGTMPDGQWGYRQVLQAIDDLNADVDLTPAQVLCGDLNVSPGSDVTRALRAAGFDYAHRPLSEIYTCNSNREAKLIDHIFFRGLDSDPIRLPVIDSRTPLPSLAEPSDHLPLVTRFAWR